jgi:hypothetical protein
MVGGFVFSDSVPEPQLQDIIIIDTTKEDRIKYEEKRTRLQAEQELNIKLKRSNRWKRDLVIPELKIGDRMKIVILTLNAAMRSGCAVTYYEPIEYDFLIEKIYIHDNVPEAKRVWYGGLYFIGDKKMWKIFPRAHILTVGKGLESIGCAKEREVSSIELESPKKKVVEKETSLSLM